MYKKNRFLFLPLLYNILPFLYLSLRIGEIRYLADLYTNWAFPHLGTPDNSPDIFNLWYYIFQFNGLLFLFYILIASLSVLVIFKLKRNLKFCLLALLEALLITLVILYPAYLFPLLLSYHFSLLLSFYFSLTKKEHLLFIFVFLYSLCGVILNILYHSFTLGFQNFSHYFLEYGSFSTNLYFLANMSKYILIDSFTVIYWIPVITIVLSFILSLIKNKKAGTVFYTGLMTGILFIMIGLINTGLFYVNNRHNPDVKRTVEPVSSEYSAYLKLGLGNYYLKDNKYYFERCFDTINGEYTVYSEVSPAAGNPFDLNKTITFDKTIILDQNGNDILSVADSGNSVNVFITTKVENTQGYNNLILVEKFDEKTFYTFTFYDLSGNLVMTLPEGLPAEQKYMGYDGMDPNSLRVVFINGELIYKEVGNSGPVIINLDGTFEPNL